MIGILRLIQILVMGLTIHGVTPPPHTVDVWVMQSFGFSESVMEDIHYVAQKTGEDIAILSSLVNRESDGKYVTTRYCLEWKTTIHVNKETGEESFSKKCEKEKSCYSKCGSREEVWNNHLDSGLWQLRDVVEKGSDGKYEGWSWLRYYNGHCREEGEKAVRSKCALDRECSRKVVICAINYLKERAEKSGSRCISHSGKKCLKRCKEPEGGEKYRWLQYWNGCKSYQKHVRTVLRLREEAKL